MKPAEIRYAFSKLSTWDQFRREHFKGEQSVGYRVIRHGGVLICPCCESESRTVRERSRLTSYCASLDHLNYLTSCLACYKRDCDLMQEQWDEYYRGRL